MTLAAVRKDEGEDGATPPLDGVALAPLLAPFGPFEDNPHLAVAVSGGADSLCLCLAADDWARARGGRVTALTVDHGLRQASTDEAATVAGWLADRGIAHHVLAWRGDKPTAGVQAAARTARYALLEGWCRDNGVLHLLLAHHADDQAETYLMRHARGSGPDGLAAMAALTETGAVRLLRPLLGVAGRRLRATLAAAGQDWVEDPSNTDTRFERVRLRLDRGLVSDLARDTADLADRVGRFGAERQARQTLLSRVLTACCDLDPTGFARLDVAKLSTFPALAEAVVSCVLVTVAGRAYPPARDKLARAAEAVLAGRDGALGGCRWWHAKGRAVVCREARGLPAPARLESGEGVLWDNRFRVRSAVSCVLGALGEDGWNSVRDDVAAPVAARVPYGARLALPALIDGEGVFAVPSLGYKRKGLQTAVFARFRPRIPLGGAGFVPAMRI